VGTSKRIVHDVRLVLNGVVEGANDVERYAAAVGSEGFERRILARRDERDQARSYRAMSDCRIGPHIETAAEMIEQAAMDCGTIPGFIVGVVVTGRSAIAGHPAPFRSARCCG